VMILNDRQQTEQTKPALEPRARGYLKNGYSLLTSYECMKPEDQKTRRGYEWFGQTAPPHEALTAYGLLQFREMARVFPVENTQGSRPGTTSRLWGSGRPKLPNSEFIRGASGTGWASPWGL